MKPPLRQCAIYTRKSTEEGLDQDFNSLDAQREACEAYITSQKSEGWTTSNEAYNDGGFSGGNIQRPALQQLLQDIKAGKINIVVVYKIDRLTRSLMDFSKLVEIFDQYQVTFVSVTQSFNTTTSMGRLTLNVLLSFAQFEREVIGERTRDKIMASKRKGMWMGGVPPLGYEVHDRQLVINIDEAKTVRYIFEKYLEDACVKKLRSELKNRGIKSKHWTSSKGHIHAACDFSRGALYYLLGNPIYAGFVKHKKNMYPGLHEAIISKELWDKVQASLKAQAAAPRGRSAASHKTLLKGKIFDREKNLYTPVYTSKRGKHYRYYLNQHISNSADHLQKDMARFPAHMIEQFVQKTLRTELAKSRELAGLLEMDFEEDYNTVNKVVAALAEVTTEELLAIVKKVIISDDQLAIEVCPNRFKAWVMEKCRVQLQGFDAEAVFKFQVPFQTRRAAKGAWVIKSDKDPDGFLCLPPQELSNLIRGIVWRDEYFTGTPAAIIAEREGLDPSHVHRLIRRSLEIA